MAEALIQTWRTNDRITAYLLEALPDALWPLRLPGAPRRTIRMIAGHLHNNRCRWIKAVGRRFGQEPPPSVDRRTVERDALLAALSSSGPAMEALIAACVARGGTVPGLALDATHFVAYHVAHEAHHRGQIIMLARQLGHRLPADVTNGVWQWSKRAKEASIGVRRGGAGRSGASRSRRSR